jgi:hypothetical protein
LLHLPRHIDIFIFAPPPLILMRRHAIFAAAAMPPPLTLRHYAAIIAIADDFSPIIAMLISRCRLFAITPCFSH